MNDEEINKLIKYELDKLHDYLWMTLKYVEGQKKLEGLPENVRKWWRANKKLGKKQKWVRKCAL